MQKRQIVFIADVDKTAELRQFPQSIHARINNIRYELIQDKLALTPSMDITYFQQEAAISAQITLLDSLIGQFGNDTFKHLEETQ